MPQKLNKAGKMQDYIPKGNGDASGEYGTSNGTNKNFTKPNVITENKTLTPKKENESKVVMSDRKDEETKANQKVVEANVIDDMEKINAKEVLDKIIDPNINYSSEKEVKQVGDMLKDLDSIVDYEIKYKDASGNERTMRATDVDSEQFVKMLDATIGKNANYTRNAERLSNTKVMVKDGDGNRKEVVANAKTLKQMLNRAKRESKANIIDGDLTGKEIAYDGSEYKSMSKEETQSIIDKLEKAGARKDTNFTGGRSYEIYDKDLKKWNKISFSEDGKMFTTTINGSVYAYDDLDTAIDRATYKSGKAPSNKAIGWETGTYNQKVFDAYSRKHTKYDD